MSFRETDCVQCPKTPPPCPTCAEDEYCIQTPLDCHSCPSRLCVKKNRTDKDSNKDKGANLGGIVGGVVAAVVVGVLLLLVLYYFKFWRHRKRGRSSSNISIDIDDEKILKQVIANGSHDGTYIENNNDIYQARNRSSAATVMTRASNVLPVAYIPGVTAVGKKTSRRRLFNNGDIRSHITLGSSILGGDDDDIDEGSEIASYIADRNSTADKPPALTTAIRGKAKLVQITEEDEDNRNAGAGKTGAGRSLPGDDSLIRTIYSPSISNPIELDIISDHIEIDSEENQKTDTKGSSDAASSNTDDEGSFILDVEVAEPIKR
ncbi:HBL124Cp [Eremothecium sinecaudum]|uniref:HBL124Cp n=1 Tax=Eremothecium sinecaudum TaxID=45286 RepID=A0A109UWD6_9SACH|nr:HBL124Cp [Eremothecium sinecaudum]AMD18778.1 HBL124Cp [Eremothecium sinecaudum]